MPISVLRSIRSEVPQPLTQKVFAQSRSCRDDKKCGRGKFWTADGESYDGEFRDSKFEGWGRYTWANGEVYTGEWKDGSQNGFGIQTWPDGQMYTGQWKQVRGGLIEDTGTQYTHTQTRGS